MATVSSDVSDEQRDQLDLIAKQKLVKRSVVIRWAVHEYLERFFSPECSVKSTIDSSTEHPSITESATPSN